MRSGYTACVVVAQLPFADHVHELNAAKDDACATKGFEAQHRPNDPLNRSVVLFDDVVEILALSNDDRRVLRSVVGFDGSFVGAALVDGHDLGRSVVLDGTGEETVRRSLIAFGGQ